MNALFTKKMMKANLTLRLLKSLVLTCGILLLGTSHAAKKDLAQEITIKSQRQAADLKNKIASYLDDVSIRQGSISITADIVKVFSRENKETSEKDDTYQAKGKPAIFQQQLEDGSLISLQADEITYHPSSNIITISGNAIVKQAGSEVSGNKITYNTLSEKLEAQSADNQSVTTVLQPRVLKKQKDAYDKSKADQKVEKPVEIKKDKEGNNSDH
jgi:lipopolysaccharide export system protein LptA